MTGVYGKMLQFKDTFLLWKLHLRIFVLQHCVFVIVIDSVGCSKSVEGQCSNSYSCHDDYRKVKDE